MMTDACTLTAQHTVLGTPIGDLTVVRRGDLLTGLYFPHHWYKPDPVTFGPRNDRGFEGVAGQLEEASISAATKSDAAAAWESTASGCGLRRRRPGQEYLRSPARSR